MIYGISAIVILALMALKILWRIKMTVDDILAKVTAEKTVVDSAVALLSQLSQAIKDAGTDPAKLQALSDAIDAQQSELASAVTANTPAAPGA